MLDLGLSPNCAASLEQRAKHWMAIHIRIGQQRAELPPVRVSCYLATSIGFQNIRLLLVLSHYLWTAVLKLRSTDRIDPGLAQSTLNKWSIMLESCA